jgi:hypothetical protein
LRNLSRQFRARTLRAIIRNLRLQTQLQTLWKSGENLNDLHAAEMVQNQDSSLRSE